MKIILIILGVFVILINVALSILGIVMYRNYKRLGHFFWLKTSFLPCVPSVLWEVDEQETMLKYIKPSDIILQLGGNVGGSCILADRIVENKTAQMCVEPNPKLLSILKRNKKNNGAHFQIIDGALTKSSGAKLIVKKSNPYGDVGATVSFGEEGNGVPIKTIDLKEIPDNFNVIFADCEGCLPPFIEEYTEVLKKVRLLIYERDEVGNNDYGKMEKRLEQSGFKVMEKGRVWAWLKTK